MGLHNISYRVSHRDIKYPRLEFSTGKLLVVLPFGFKPGPILDKHRSWIVKKMGFIEECLKDASNKKMVERTEKEFRNLIHSSVKRTSKELGMDLNKIYFRTMKTKWASCSPKKNLTINALMKHLPTYLLKYVIFHEIAHLKEKRHSNKFWKIVSKKFNNYQALERDLFVYWFQLANRIK